MPTIVYAVDTDSGLVVSRLLRTRHDHEGLEGGFAWPVFDFEAIGKDGDYSKPLTYNLERIENISGNCFQALVWTKKIPLEIKNMHREFWGLKPLKPSRKNLPPKQAEILALLDEAPADEPSLAAATGRKAGKAFTFLRSLEAKGLATFDLHLLKWKTV